MNFHQSVEEILKTATPEQRLIWNYIFLRWGERVPISQFVYMGTVAGAGELLVYSARKLYFAYQLETAQDATSASGFFMRLYDENNAVFFTVRNMFPYWDATAAGLKYVNGNCTSYNNYFSRLEFNAVDRVKFIGYRLGI
jgi:hypothetical protein